METKASSVRRNFDAIDICKLIAALFVVGIHSHPLESVSQSANFTLFECLSRFAVPFFFVSSSFFFFRGGVNGEKLKHYEQRMAILYAIWYVLALPVTFSRKYWMYFTSYSLPVALWKSVRGLLFASSFRGSWFLSGSMFCAAAIYFLSKKLTSKQIIQVSGAVYLFCVLCSTYGGVIDRLGLGAVYETLLYYFAKPYTSIITGLLYFAIGKYMAEREETLTNQDPKKYGILSLITLAGMVLELMAAKRLGLVESTDCCLMLIPNVYCLMTFLLSVRVKVKHVREIRASSIIVFFVHFSVLYAIQMMEKYWGLQISTLTRYLIILLVSFHFAWFVLRMEKKEHWSWMRYLH